MTLKVKIICGFRKDQEYSVSADEAHKAYYLFLHPSERGVFNDGLAIIGSQIQEIVPDYQGTMGWNPTHMLDNDDWNELRSSGVEKKLRDVLSLAKQVSQRGIPSELNKPLSSFLLEENSKPSDEAKELAKKMTVKPA